MFALYILKRILFFIPTWFLLATLTFSISRCVKGDPLDNLIADTENTKFEDNISSDSYRRNAQKWGYDLPVFYADIQASAYPDTLHRIVRKIERETAEQWLLMTGNWQKIQDFRQEIHIFQTKIKNLPPSDTVVRLQNTLLYMLIQDDTSILSATVDTFLAMTKSSHILVAAAEILAQKKDIMLQNEAKMALFIPKITYYGTQNQFHRWFTNLLKGNFGTSHRDGKPVFDILIPPLSITFILGSLTLIFSYFVSVPLGLWLVHNHKKRRSSWVRSFLISIYAIPSFAIATISMMLFTTSVYGLKIFPAIGSIETDANDSFFTLFVVYFPHLILPVLCFSTHIIAMLTLQVSQNAEAQSAEDYVKVAKAKGLSAYSVLLWHIFPNTVFPLIALFAQFLPILVGGSLLIEYIFNIAGMGHAAHQAIVSRDYPVFFSIVLLTAFIVSLGNLISDILYKFANPKETF